MNICGRRKRTYTKLSGIMIRRCIRWKELVSSTAFAFNQLVCVCFWSVLSWFSAVLAIFGYFCQFWPVATGSYGQPRLFPANFGRFRLISANFSQFRSFPANFSQLRPFPANFSQFRPFPANSSQFQQIPAISANF